VCSDCLCWRCALTLAPPVELDADAFVHEPRQVQHRLLPPALQVSRATHRPARAKGRGWM